jgi:hypothetical protein
MSRSSFSASSLLLVTPLAAALALTSACTELIGVEEVELEAPPPPPVNCSVSPRFSLISSNPTTSRLSRRADGGPSMIFLLNADAKADSLGALLYPNMGGHGALEAPGTYAITAADSKFETCGICLLVNTDFDTTTSKFLETFLAEPQGTLTITTATTTRLAGHLRGLKFRKVDLSGGTTREVSSPCSVAIDDVYFDMEYSTGQVLPLLERSAP